ncbi:5-cytosine rRNA methyltransferase NSUN4-like isoform X2 [Antedon mediterranea]
MKSKYEPTQLALKYFDKHYKLEFGEKWPSVRLALLSKQKHGALVNNFAHPIAVEEKLSQLGAKDCIPSMRSLLETENQNIEENSQNDIETLSNAKLNQKTEEAYNNVNNDMLINSSSSTYAPKVEYIVPEQYVDQMSQFIPNLVDNSTHNIDIGIERKQLSISENLKCYIFDGSAVKRFPPAKYNSETYSYLEYYLLDASSLFPVLSLDLQPGDMVLDMCAAPGGKSVAMMQTMNIGGIVCNEVAPSRRRRLQDALQLCIPKHILNDEECFRITEFDGTEWGNMEPDTYDKILVDVPCTTDRIVATENDNNIFHPKRLKERSRLPLLQTELLSAALKSVKVGGTVVYSTCTMSSEQNENVVQRAVYECLQNDSIQVLEIDLSPLTRICNKMFNFHDKLKLGQIVVPSLSANFGPMYFCALKRLN